VAIRFVFVLSRLLLLLLLYDLSLLRHSYLSVGNSILYVEIRREIRICISVVASVVFTVITLWQLPLYFFFLCNRTFTYTARTLCNVHCFFNTQSSFCYLRYH